MPINLIDGLDGLAGGVVLTALGAFGLLAATDGVDPMLPIIAATGGAAVGFLAYNLHPASIIMGDAGSMFLGFVVAAIAIFTDPGRHRPGAAVRPDRRARRPARSTRPGPSCDARPRRAVLRGRPRPHPPPAAAAGLSQRDAMLLLTAVSAGLAVIAVLLAEGGPRRRRSGLAAPRRAARAGIGRPQVPAGERICPKSGAISSRMASRFGVSR